MTAVFERPPETIEVGGRTYPINIDFRAGIELECAVLNDRIDLAQLLQLYYPVCIPTDLEGAVDAMMQFYRCGSVEEAQDDAKSHAPSLRAYDFEQDADAIYAAFRAVYDIDLDTAQLHWWTFRRLLRGLPEDCEFMRRVYVRTADLSQMGKEQRKSIQKLRNKYALRKGGKRMTLAERNAAMLEYAAKRLEAAQCSTRK